MTIQENDTQEHLDVSHHSTSPYRIPALAIVIIYPNCQTCHVVSLARLEGRYALSHYLDGICRKNISDSDRSFWDSNMSDENVLGWTCDEGMNFDRLHYDVKGMTFYWYNGCGRCEKCNAHSE